MAAAVSFAHALRFAAAGMSMILAAASAGAQVRSDAPLHQWSEGEAPIWPAGVVIGGGPVIFAPGATTIRSRSSAAAAPAGAAAAPVRSGPNVVLGWGGLPPSTPASAGLNVRNPSITPAGTLFR